LKSPFEEMLDSKIDGVVRAEPLIDVDGTVKDVRVLNDLGYGTKEAARKAFPQWTFKTAKKGATPAWPYGLSLPSGSFWCGRNA
jgi:hypothetical protein